MNWIFYVTLAVVLLGSLYITLLNLPGLWIMAAGTLLYAIFTGFAFAGWKTLIVVFFLAAMAEAIDFFGGAAGAKKAGASRRGLIGALIGGIAGGILLTFFLPIILTIVGICVGTFAGAILGELWGGTQVGKSVRIGFGAAWGRLVGILTKLMFGCTILAVVLIAALPRNPNATLPSRNPSAPPATSPLRRAGLDRRAAAHNLILDFGGGLPTTSPTI